MVARKKIVVVKPCSIQASRVYPVGKRGLWGNYMYGL